MAMVMMKRYRSWKSRIGALLLAAAAVSSVTPVVAAEAGAGADEDKLYVVATAHLDTQWRWTIRTTIDEYIPATLKGNFALFETFPDYVFSFEGAFRYQLMKEYYPEEYERLKSYISAGRWRVAGSWLDAVDVNVPSPESLIRHTLYGNGYFRREFGVTSRDVYLPDCFGFGFALPSIASHAGLTGFSTQKLTWGSSVGIPFDIGLWEGVDGSTLVAAINPGEYVGKLTGDLSRDEKWRNTIAAQRERSGLSLAFAYFGVGDRGGAPDEESVRWLETSLNGDGPVRVISTGSDQLARDLADDEARTSTLPRYRGELLMTDHGVGCYTSQSAMKRWNRKNEILADAAERASVAAYLLGGIDYPRETFREAWTRFLWHQFHDDLTGTSIPEAYSFSWNDEVISANQFSAMLTDAVGAVSQGLDTAWCKGIPLVVFNPLAFEREDVVTCQVQFDGSQPSAVRVFGPNGREVPSQAVSRGDGRFDLVFPANVPATGFAVYDVRTASGPCTLDTLIEIGPDWMENERYRVTLDEDGNIASILDTSAGRELLDGPCRLQLLDNAPEEWAAWEIDYDEIMAEPRAMVKGPASIRIIESGPVRVGLEITREAAGSTFVQRIRLAAGAAADTVEVESVIDWRTPATLLKAAFPLTLRSENATYDLGVGTIERGVNRSELYEVPAQRWVDLTGTRGFGAALFSDCRHGWDRPDEQTLRLTLIHTPEVNENWTWIEDQRSQDLGRHIVRYGFFGHRGEWRTGGVARAADRFNQPLLAFVTTTHEGGLGRKFSLLSVNSGRTADRFGMITGSEAGAAAAGEGQVAVKAVKLAEESDELVVRLQETWGRPAEKVKISFAWPVVSAREINGAEEEAGPAMVEYGDLVVSFKPYQPRSFALRLADPPVRLALPHCIPLDLPYNMDGVSTDGDRTDGNFDGRGHTISGDLLPKEIVREGLRFVTGPTADGTSNVLACQGQTITLPETGADRLYLLAAAVGGDRDAVFKVGDREHRLRIHDWEEPVGQWDDRLDGDRLLEDPDSIRPAYIKPARVGWIGTHRHGPDGVNQSYLFTHFFVYALDVPPGAAELTLSDDEGIRILAATLVMSGNDDTIPLQPLFDETTRSSVRILADTESFPDGVMVSLRSPNPGAEIRYTLDGSDPDERSTLFTEPFFLPGTSTVRARAFVRGLENDYVAEAVFIRRP